MAVSPKDSLPEHYDAARFLAERAPEPAVVGGVRTGTAGWTDPSLVRPGLFYPKGVRSAEGRLRHYAAHFGMVEVDATYYALLPPEVSTRWVSWTYPEFEMDIKAYPVLTGHPIDVRRLPADLRDEIPVREGRHRIYPDDLPAAIAQEIESRFFTFVEPLATAKRLGCVMLQFPPWVQATRRNVRRLEEIRDRWPGVPFSVEFRHKSWMADDRRSRVVDLLSALGMSYVVVDEPDVATGGVPPISAVTRPELAIVRFHGQNAAGWKRGASVAERFDYLYRAEELRSWAEPVRRLADQAGRVHAVFNNCVRDYAVLNAKGLAVLLDGQMAGTQTPG